MTLHDAYKLIIWLLMLPFVWIEEFYYWLRRNQE